MNWAHLHLALNHVPVVGLPIVLLLLAWAILRRSAELLKASFGLIILLAVVTVIVQVTGEPAEELIEGLPGVVDSIVETHEESALLGTVGVVVVGVIALFGLWRLGTGKILPQWYSPVVLIAGIMVAGLMVWIANLGGQIRHSEIRPSASASVERTDRASDMQGLAVGSKYFHPRGHPLCSSAKCQPCEFSMQMRFCRGESRSVYYAVW